MRLYNTQQHYGFLTIFFHWLIALLMIGLFIVGLIISDLDYGDSSFKQLVFFHEAIGLTVFLLAILRISWLWWSPSPQFLSSMQPWENKLAGVAHTLLLVSTAIVPVSGYILSTSSGESVDWFGVFQVPALIVSDALEEGAGEAHKILAYATAALVVLHVLAALKHHFWDKDKTLTRILRSKL